MEKTSGLIVDKKFIVAMILVCIALSGSFAFIYLDLKRDFEDLRDKYDAILGQTQQLQSLINLIESEHYEKVSNLTAVQIYNLTKYSVVLISCTLADESRVQGSGFVYDVQGHIVTNNHVVENAESINVTFFNGTTFKAQLVGRDVYSDLAVIKVDALPEQSYPLIIGDSTQLRVGEPVYAIGNPFGLRGSMTAGIVSQLGRVIRLGDLGVPDPWGKYSIADLIQFDAAINPGNSGGPLLNGNSEVVGVTFAIETVSDISAFIGIGYAVPSVILKRVVPALIKNGTYVHPYMGVGYDGEYMGGMRITYIEPNGPADKAGLRKEDIIIEVDNQTLTCADDLIIYLERYKSPGDIIRLRVKRDNTVLENLIELTLGEREV